MSRYTLIYDGSCSFCVGLVRWLKRRDRRSCVTYLPCQDLGAISGLGLSQQECMQSAWLVRPNGAKHRGADAVLLALATVLGVPKLAFAWRLPGVRQVTEWLYRAVARHRHCLSRDSEQGCGDATEKPLNSPMESEIMGAIPGSTGSDGSSNP